MVEYEADDSYKCSSFILYFAGFISIFEGIAYSLLIVRAGVFVGFWTRHGEIGKSLGLFWSVFTMKNFFEFMFTVPFHTDWDNYYLITLAVYLIFTSLFWCVAKHPGGEKEIREAKLLAPMNGGT